MVRALYISSRHHRQLLFCYNFIRQKLELAKCQQARGRAGWTDTGPEAFLLSIFRGPLNRRITAEEFSLGVCLSIEKKDRHSRREFGRQNFTMDTRRPWKEKDKLCICICVSRYVWRQFILSSMYSMLAPLLVGSRYLSSLLLR